MEFFKNKNWIQKSRPLISVIVPVYNRQDLLSRALLSVEKQTFNDIELIIVDDGSTDNSLSVASAFLNKTFLSACIIAKNNGGVHTARNEGIRISRGKFIFFLDSDDEILPKALEIFVTKYNEMPSNIKNNIFEIKAKVVSGEKIPKSINSQKERKRNKYLFKTKSEMDGFRLAYILKNNLFPEPKNITFVSENILWLKLRAKYRTWVIDDEVRIYHNDGQNRLTRPSNKNIQHLKNRLWNAMTCLNENKIYLLTFKSLLKNLLIYYTFYFALKRKEIDITFLKKQKNYFSQFFIIPIGYLLSRKY